MSGSSTKQTLGGYELIDRVSGREPFEVWKAWHTALARPAAVKVLFRRTGLRSDDHLAESVRHIVREAQLTSSLHSPHVPQVHDLGVVGEEAVYFAMEFLEGLNAEHFVYRFGAVVPRRAVRWLQHVCHALAELHARGLIHGDIKPANVFVSHHSSNLDHITLLDFGCARVPEQEATSDSKKRLWHPGTPGYVAPEQILGAIVDSRADVYAIGCFAYFLLTGRELFEAEDDEQLAQHHVAAPPPSPRSPSQSPLPVALEALVMRCLSKDPRDRPADARAVRLELAAFEGSPWDDLEASAWWEKHRGDP